MFCIQKVPYCYLVWKSVRRYVAREATGIQLEHSEISQRLTLVLCRKCFEISMEDLKNFESLILHKY